MPSSAGAGSSAGGSSATGASGAGSSAARVFGDRGICGLRLFRGRGGRLGCGGAVVDEARGLVACAGREGRAREEEGCECEARREAALREAAPLARRLGGLRLFDGTGLRIVPAESPKGPGGESEEYEADQIPPRVALWHCLCSRCRAPRPPLRRGSLSDVIRCRSTDSLSEAAIEVRVIPLPGQRPPVEVESLRRGILPIRTSDDAPSSLWSQTAERSRQSEAEVSSS